MKTENIHNYNINFPGWLRYALIVFVWQVVSMTIAKSFLMWIEVFK